VDVEQDDVAGVDPGEWVRALAARLDENVPDEAEVEALLSLAGTAAHAAQRWVAPVSTWLVGRAGLPPAEARALVEQVAAELDRPDGRSAVAG
jgi:hypothetical protein